VLAGSFGRGAGRFPAGQNWLTSRASGQRVYLPPPAAAVPTLIEGLCAWANAGDEMAAIQAAVVHVSLAGLHPFKAGSGRTARIAASLAMYRGGYRMPQFTSLQGWWVATPKATTHPSTASTANGIPRPMSAPLSRRTWAPRRRNRYYRSVADVSRVTASHDLAKLVASGLLQSRGAGRSPRYIATPELYRRIISTAELEPSWLAGGDSREEARDLAFAGLAARLHESGTGR